MITERDITTYHKNGSEWLKTNTTGTFRGTSIQNRTNSGVDNVDTGLLRIFNEIDLDIDDLIVIKKIEDTENISLIKLKEKYGDDKVFKVKSINNYMLGTELDHIKIGLI